MQEECHCQVGCCAHFILGFPRDAPRKESDCHRGQQGDWRSNGLSAGKDGGPPGGDSEVKRNSKEGKDSVPTDKCTLTCPDVSLHILTYTCQCTEAGTSTTDACTHTHIHTQLQALIGI